MRKLCHSALRRHVPSCLHNPPHATLTIADLIMRKLCHSALRRHVPSCLHNPPLRTTSTFYHFRKFTRLCDATFRRASIILRSALRARSTISANSRAFAPLSRPLIFFTSHSQCSSLAFFAVLLQPWLPKQRLTARSF